VRSTSSICILTKLLESKDFTVTLAVQLLCGPFGSNAHKPAGQAILTKLLESKDFTVTSAVQLLRGNFGSNAHKPAGVQMFNSVYQHLIRLHTQNLPQVLVSILTTKLCILKISTAAENLLVNCRPGNVEDVTFVAKLLRANFTSSEKKNTKFSEVLVECLSRFQDNGISLPMNVIKDMLSNPRKRDLKRKASDQLESQKGN
jgi:hypothetical protein